MLPSNQVSMASCTRAITGPGSSPGFGLTERMSRTATGSGAKTATSTAISRFCSNRSWTCLRSSSPGRPSTPAMITSTVPIPRFLGRTRTAVTPSTAKASWA